MPSMLFSRLRLCLAILGGQSAEPSSTEKPIQEKSGKISFCFYCGKNEEDGPAFVYFTRWENNLTCLECWKALKFEKENSENRNVLLVDVKRKEIIGLPRLHYNRLQGTVDGKKFCLNAIGGGRAFVISYSIDPNGEWCTNLLVDFFRDQRHGLTARSSFLSLTSGL